MRTDSGSRFLVLAALVAIVGVVLGQNFFGREMNVLFLQMPGVDKVLHFFEYVLVYFALYALAGRVWADDRARTRRAVVAGVLLALADETMQRFAPGRSVERFDVVANFAGLTLGWFAARPRRTAGAWTAAALAVAACAYVTWHTHVLLIDYSRGLEYSRRQDFVRARDHFRRALDAGLRTPGLYNELGWVEIESGVGDPARAVEYSRIALDMQPRNADVLDTYGWALHHARRPEEALAALRAAYALDPDIYCIHYHLGAAYLAAGHRDQAAYHFRRQAERPGTREAAFARRALERLEARR